MRAYSFGDTIFAQSSGVGRSAVAIIRVSGPSCREILSRLCPGVVFQNRHAKLAAVLDDVGDLLDYGIVLKFDEPRSYTGQEMIEFQLTGSRAITTAMTRALSSFAGVRPAEPGEFAWRAFVSGKLDLVKVEGLASVVEAETRAQLRHALKAASGEVSLQLNLVNDILLNVTAVVESMLDFSDVEEVATLQFDEAISGVRRAAEELTRLLSNSVATERLKDGFVVAIAGPPNAGKSTLLNYLAKREVAIVSEIPGTTRDTLEVQAEIAGYPVVFVDTAGIRETSDPIEILGIARARRKFETADLVLWLDEGGGSIADGATEGKLTLQVRTKADICLGSPAKGMEISAITGAGIEALINDIGLLAGEHFAGTGQLSLGTDRQRAAAQEALRALGRILDRPNIPLEIFAEDLRIALDGVGRIVGRIGVEEILGEIFSRLCVGK